MSTLSMKRYRKDEVGSPGPVKGLWIPKGGFWYDLLGASLRLQLPEQVPSQPKKEETAATSPELTSGLGVGCT